MLEAYRSNFCVVDQAACNDRVFDDATEFIPMPVRLMQELQSRGFDDLLDLRDCVAY